MLLTCNPPRPDRRALLSMMIAVPACAAVPSARTIALRERLSSTQRMAVERGIADPSLVTVLRDALMTLGTSGGGILDLGPGSYLLPAAALTEIGLRMPSGVIIRGASRDATQLRVVGREPARLIVAIDADAIAIERLTLIGNGVSTGEGVGAAILLAQSTARTLADVRVTEIALDNFGAPGWLHVIAGDAGALWSGLRFADIVAYSRSGNAFGRGSVRENSAVIRIDANRATVREIAIDRLDVDARYIKSGVILYDRIIGATLTDCVIRDAGRQMQDDAGAYAIQCYDSRGLQSGITIVRPVVERPRSCGIYVAGINDLSIVDPTIHGQTDRRNETLPKGAIVMLGVVGGSIVGGRLSGNEIDVAIVPRRGQSALAIRISGLTTSGARVASILASVAEDTRRWNGMTIADCRIDAIGRGIAIANSARASFDTVTISKTAVTARGIGVDLFMDAPSAATGYLLSGSRIHSNVLALRARQMRGALTVRDSTLTSQSALPLEAVEVGEVRFDHVGLSAPVDAARRAISGRIVAIDALTTVPVRLPSPIL